MTISRERQRAMWNRSRELRGRRRELKADMRAERVVLADVLREVPDDLRTMRVRELLMAVPRLGQSKVDRVLDVHGISPGARLLALSKTRRAELLKYLAGHHPGVPVNTPRKDAA